MKKMYEFSLVLEGVDDKTPGLEDALFEAGCDDALINFRNGTVFLDFNREGDSFEKAMFSAIHAVENCGLNAKVIQILPDVLVNISDIVKRLKKSKQPISPTKQLVSLWVKGERRQRGLPFPPPVSKLSEKSPMWRWYSVLIWLQQQKLIEDPEIVDSAKLLQNTNAVLDERDPEVKKDRHDILKKLEQKPSQQTHHQSQNPKQKYG